MKSFLIKRLCRIGALVLLCWSAPAAGVAQSNHGPFSLGIQGGAGDGPSVASLIGVEAGVRVTRFLSVRGEFHRWNAGFGVGCQQSWPESYQCDIGGNAYLVGVRGSIPTSYGSPYLELKSGVHVRDDLGEATETASPIQLKVGVEKGLGTRWYIGLSGQAVWVLDDAYEDLLGETLGYRTLQVGLGFRN